MSTTNENIRKGNDETSWTRKRTSDPFSTSPRLTVTRTPLAEVAVEEDEAEEPEAAAMLGEGAAGFSDAIKFTLASFLVGARSRTTQ